MSQRRCILQTCEGSGSFSALTHSSCADSAAEMQILSIPSPLPWPSPAEGTNTATHAMGTHYLAIWEVVPSLTTINLWVTNRSKSSYSACCLEHPGLSTWAPCKLNQLNLIISHFPYLKAPPQAVRMGLQPHKLTKMPGSLCHQLPTQVFLGYQGPTADFKILAQLYIY